MHSQKSMPTKTSTAADRAKSKRRQDEPVLGRFAPSPTGSMHAGNIYAALNAWLLAKSQGGKILLRIEDLDPERSKQEHADKIMRDFERLGLTWDIGPVYQSKRTSAYRDALSKLNARCEVYPCFCSRADLKAHSAPHAGETSVYDGRCRNFNASERLEMAVELASSGRVPSYRIAVPDMNVAVQDLYSGEIAANLAKDVGDFVVKRSDGGFAYQLAVVVDDAEFGVNSVVRGCDLIPSTPQQAFLCDVLGYETPEYAHIPLLCAEDGRRLSKRDSDAEIDALMAEYGSPEVVLGHIAYIGGLQDDDVPATAEELLSGFSIDKARAAFEGRDRFTFK